MCEYCGRHTLSFPRCGGLQKTGECPYRSKSVSISRRILPLGKDRAGRFASGSRRSAPLILTGLAAFSPNQEASGAVSAPERRAHGPSGIARRQGGRGSGRPDPAKRKRRLSVGREAATQALSRDRAGSGEDSRRVSSHGGDIGTGSSSTRDASSRSGAGFVRGCFPSFSRCKGVRRAAHRACGIRCPQCKTRFTGHTVVFLHRCRRHVLR